MMDKKECEKAVKILEEEPTSFADIFNKIGALAVIDNLIEEHFDPKPYKFEELKVGMLVWCENVESIVYIKDIDFFGMGRVELVVLVVGKDEPISLVFEENRFFPLTKAKGE